MKYETTITFTVELTRDTDEGDALDKDILTEVALDQLIDERDDEEFINNYVEVTYL